MGSLRLRRHSLTKYLSPRGRRLLIFRASALLLGLFLTGVVLELGLRIGGCLLRPEPFQTDPSPSQAADFLIVCVGDSHTQGIGAPQGQDYPSQLSALLNTSDPGRIYRVVNLGRSGYNSSEAVNRMLTYLAGGNPKPDLVIFCGGANNDHNLSEARFLPEDIAKMSFSLRLSHLLSESRAYRLSQSTTKRIRGLLVKREDEGNLRFDDLLNIGEESELKLLEEWIHKDIEMLWQELRLNNIPLMLMNYFHHTAQVDPVFSKAAEAFGIPFVDVRNFGDPEYKALLNKKALVAPNFHPNQYGYAKIVEKIHLALIEKNMISR